MYFLNKHEHEILKSKKVCNESIVTNERRHVVLTVILLLFESEGFHSAKKELSDHNTFFYNQGVSSFVYLFNLFTYFW